MYKVIKYFTDLKDNNHPYNVGDIFPREGIEVGQRRLNELSGSKNRQKTPLIKFVEDDKQVVTKTANESSKVTQKQSTTRRKRKLSDAK